MPSAPVTDKAAEDEAADVTLTETDEHGFEEALAARRGRVVLVDFWATWCLPCLAGFPHTVELYDELHNRGLDVISVSFDEAEDHDAALAFLRKTHALFTNLRSKYGFDSEVPFATDGALPVLRVYGGDGELAASFTSGNPDAEPFTPQDVRRAVEEALDALESAGSDASNAASDETGDDV
ncbi:MAG: TlpA disulfide reductase family protein [Pirellulales bacterium]